MAPFPSLIRSKSFLTSPNSDGSAFPLLLVSAMSSMICSDTVATSSGSIPRRSVQDLPPVGRTLHARPERYTQVAPIVPAGNCRHREVCRESFAKFMAFWTSSWFIRRAWGTGRPSGPPDDGGGGAMYSSCLVWFRTLIFSFFVPHKASVVYCKGGQEGGSNCGLQLAILADGS